MIQLYFAMRTFCDAFYTLSCDPTASKDFLIAHHDQSVTLNLLIGSWWKYRNMIGDLGWLIVRSDLQESRRIKKCTSNQCNCLLQDHLRHAHDHPVPQLYLLFWECQDYNNIHLLQCNHVLCYQSSPILTKKNVYWTSCIVVQLTGNTFNIYQGYTSWRYFSNTDYQWLVQQLWKI